MLRISKLADYGTVVMVYLARKAPGLCNARDIAQNTHLTVPTVSKLLKKLTLARLLTSVRGVTGGYQLQRSAAEITVAQIINALEDHQGLTECSVQHNSHCALEGFCQVQGNWRLLSQAIETALDSVTLEALARPSLKAVDIDRVRQLASGVSRVKE